MGRLKSSTLDQIESYSDRVLDVVEALEKKKCWRRVVDQLAGSGGSVGANAFEADQAVSTKDFVKCLGISVQELSETKFWLRRISRRGWINPERLQPLLTDTDEWLAIFNQMIVKTRAKARIRVP